MPKLRQPFPCVIDYRIPLSTFLFIEIQHLMPENIVGQLGLDRFDPALAQIAFLRVAGPCHHVNMRMVGLVVECRIPAEVIRRNFHGGGNFVAVGPKQAPPCHRIVIPQPCGILSFQRDDMGPHAPGMALNFGFGGVQVHGIAIPEQAVTAPLFRAGARGNVVHATLYFLYSIAGGDIVHILFCFRIWFQIRAFQNQLCHTASCSSRFTWSKVSAPCVRRTAFMESFRSS